MSKYFGTDGVRGVAGSVLTDRIAFAIGFFIGQYPNNNRNKILIARDTRISGEELSASLIAGIVAAGGEAYDEGVSTTPSVSYLVNKHHFNYGVMISASHNPYYDNGIKIFNNKGEKLSHDIELLIENHIDGSDDGLSYTNEHGSVHRGSTLLNEYIDYVVKNASGIDKNIKLLIDCANGSASNVIPRIIGKLGLKADYICNHPNGKNINELCGSTHLDNLVQNITKGQYDLGVAFDGDADRVLFVGPDGTKIDGDCSLYIFAKYLKEKKKLSENTIVLTVMSNIGLKKALKSANISIKEVNVGDRYVQKALKENRLVLGGEQSGHIIFFNLLNTGDGILTLMQLLKIMSEKKSPVLELLKNLMIYPQKLENVQVSNKDAIMQNEILLDVLRLKEEELGDKGRILIRPSGTEQLIRVMCEAESMEMCDNVVNSLVDLIKNIAI